MKQMEKIVKKIVKMNILKKKIVKLIINSILLFIFFYLLFYNDHWDILAIFNNAFEFNVKQYIEIFVELS